MLGKLTHPCPAAQTSFVQGLLSSQSLVLEPVHAPFAQLDVTVHWSPSSHSSPSLAAAGLQTPLVGSHVFFAQTVSPASVHVTALAASTWQNPAKHAVGRQRSLLVQSASTLHPQVGVPPAHAPPGPQISSFVQAFPSSQLAPITSPVTVQPTAGSHASLLHGSPSSQTPGFGLCTQPFALSHTSKVQPKPSSQLLGDPKHFPPMHASPSVHTSPSSQLSDKSAIALCTTSLPWSQ